jgi:hypothetical protein
MSLSKIKSPNRKDFSVIYGPDCKINIENPDS